MGVVGGILLSAFFWMPAVLETHYAQITQMTSGYFDFRKHFVTLDELWYSPWGYGGSGFINQFTRMAGTMQWAFLVVALARLRRGEGRWERAFFVSLFAFSVVMMLSHSTVVWSSIPLLQFLQFPWKFLAVTMLAGSCLSSAALLVPATERGKWTVFGVSVALILLCDLPHAAPEGVVDRGADFTSPNHVRMLTSDAMNLRDFTHYYTSYLPVQVTSPPTQPPASAVEVPQGVTILATEERTDRLRVRLDAPDTARVIVNTFWFPGWQASIDGQPLAIVPEPGTGRIVVTVPSGDHELFMRFGHTPLRFWSLMVSLVAMLAVVGSCLVALAGSGLRISRQT
jgi:hypothetical protein